jgi:hypothetical protein
MKKGFAIIFILFIFMSASKAGDTLNFDNYKWGSKRNEVGIKDHSSYQFGGLGEIVKENGDIKIGDFPFSKILLFKPAKGLAQVRYEGEGKDDKICHNSYSYIKNKYGIEKHKVIRNGENSQFVWDSSDNTVELICRKGKAFSTAIILILPKWQSIQCDISSKNNPQNKLVIKLYLDTWNERMLTSIKDDIRDYETVIFKKDTLEFSERNGKFSNTAKIDRKTGKYVGVIRDLKGVSYNVVGQCKSINNETTF